MKTMFVAAGDETWGSSRMRCYWVAKYMNDAAAMTNAECRMNESAVNVAEAVVFQKLADPDWMRKLRNNGKKVFWDVCDPSWWWKPKECREIAANCDGVVASSEGLARDFENWAEMPCHVIADRLDLAHFSKQRQHHETEPVRFIWFGLAANRLSLFGAVPMLERLLANGYKIELTVCDERPDARCALGGVPVYQKLWTLGEEVETLCAHDVALLPPYPGAWGKVKSPNKKLTANACGLVDVDGFDYGRLQEACGWVFRHHYGNGAVIAVRQSHDVKQSAAEWEALLR